MNTIDSPPVLPPELLAELEQACADVLNGIRRPEEMEAAARDLDVGREEILRRIGLVDLSDALTDRDG